jgi:hypothetical protein
VRQSISLLAGLAAVGALVITPAFHAPLAHAQSGECSSFPGYEQIEAGNVASYVHSDGPGAAVTMDGTGSCYKPTYAGFTYDGEPVYTYYNQDDRCLYWKPVPGEEGEVFTATNANGCSDQPNEEFVAITYDPSYGWAWYSMAGIDDGGGYAYSLFVDDVGNVINPGSSSDPNYDYFRFPSDGG